MSDSGDSMGLGDDERHPNRVRRRKDEDELFGDEADEEQNLKKNKGKDSLDIKMLELKEINIKLDKIDGILLETEASSPAQHSYTVHRERLLAKRTSLVNSIALARNPTKESATMNPPTKNPGAKHPPTKKSASKNPATKKADPKDPPTKKPDRQRTSLKKSTQKNLPQETNPKKPVPVEKSGPNNMVVRCSGGVRTIMAGENLPSVTLSGNKPSVNLSENSSDSEGKATPPPKGYHTRPPITRVQITGPERTPPRSITVETPFSTSSTSPKTNQPADNTEERKRQQLEEDDKYILTHLKTF